MTPVDLDVLEARAREHDKCPPGMLSECLLFLTTQEVLALVAAVRRAEAQRDEAVRRLRMLTACRCGPAWTGRGLHEPECTADEGWCDDLDTPWPDGERCLAGQGGDGGVCRLAPAHAGPHDYRCGSTCCDREVPQTYAECGLAPGHAGWHEAADGAVRWGP